MKKGINENQPSVQISSESNFCCIYVSKYRMKKEAGFETKLLQILDDFQLYYMHIPAGVDTLNVLIDDKQMEQTLEKELMDRIQKELAADKVIITRNLSLIMLVGDNMPQNAENIYRAARVLAEEKINIEMIHMNQGANQISLILGVNEQDEKQALAAIQEEFFAGVPVAN